MPGILTWFRGSIVVVAALVAGAGPAGAAEWRTFSIPETGLSVEIPVSIFTEHAAPAEDDRSRVFTTPDGRADLTVKSVPNPSNESPAEFLRKMHPPARIEYQRVTSGFFVVSSVKNGRTWYDRCNRARGYMNCVLINYPASENRQWDDVVTRISLSLAR